MGFPKLAPGGASNAIFQATMLALINDALLAMPMAWPQSAPFRGLNLS
jgi:hypothetical protein